ncbi:hypothetical protein [Methylobacterium haplocladii]|uniref:Uncharacterized protein n=1 Tax=Methylobacterium haplocladii TaxID=1176176 RepID=A0A512ISN5_9HYPH|nr:hypothetical protein [Methylobacterium haplocladii]GEP00649.1 hypothetical protein MHA02_30360 [Methylobacterium haplocladii]GJD85412.1 hypothetical protein HPGCJGGD_3301 [Methylobacterium haplocladii]GLS57797.1 hypothetical protein GCM10007887_04530 [Methylobacterium haplocladii]
MADLSDVVDAIAALLGSALYPDGADRASAIDADVYIVKGWPLPADLDRVVAGVKTGEARGVYVSVFPPPNLERVTTRALPQWLRVSPPAQTLSVATTETTLTIGGTVAVPQTVSVSVRDRGFAYAVQAADTPATIATALAAFIVAADIPATAAGAVVTIPTAYRLTARVGSVQRLAKEVERSQRAIMTTIWAPSPDLRKAAGRIVRSRLADTSDLAGCHNRFLPLCDGSAAWISYDHTTDVDNEQKAGIYRRDISHWFEFGEYLTVDATEVLIASAGRPAIIPPALPTDPTTFVLG